jgi:hypothetical protein
MSGLVLQPASQPLPPIDLDNIYLVCWVVLSKWRGR